MIGVIIYYSPSHSILVLVQKSTHPAGGEDPLLKLKFVSLSGEPLKLGGAIVVPSTPIVNTSEVCSFIRVLITLNTSELKLLVSLSLYDDNH